jgi:hypothetical protein
MIGMNVVHILPDELLWPLIRLRGYEAFLFLVACQTPKPVVQLFCNYIRKACACTFLYWFAEKAWMELKTMSCVSEIFCQI